jgi:putative membrane protein
MPGFVNGYIEMKKRLKNACLGWKALISSPETPLLTMNWPALFNCAAFGLLGIILITLGFKMFDMVLTKIDIEQEVAKGNVAAAVLGAAAIAAITAIVLVAIH